MNRIDLPSPSPLRRTTPPHFDIAASPFRGEISGSTSFGLITNTRNGGSAPGLGFGEPRNTQLALKILF
jgi:hypothetical protein